MITSIKIVLLSVVLVYNPNTDRVELQYNPLDYYTSISSCNVEKNKLQKRQPAESNKMFMCLKVDKN